MVNVLIQCLKRKKNKKKKKLICAMINVNLKARQIIPVP